MPGKAPPRRQERLLGTACPWYRRSLQIEYRNGNMRMWGSCFLSSGMHGPREVDGEQGNGGR